MATLEAAGLVKGEDILVITCKPTGAKPRMKCFPLADAVKPFVKLW
jgi:hypothetical protein